VTGKGSKKSNAEVKESKFEGCQAEAEGLTIDVRQSTQERMDGKVDAILRQ